MILLEGKPAAGKIKDDLIQQVNILSEKKLRAPHLVAVLIGNNGASETYVASKIKNCEEIGFQSSLIRFDTSLAEYTLLQKLGRT